MSDNEDTQTNLDDIDKVSISIPTKEIKLGNIQYNLIMCYICPFDDSPLLAYWILNGKERANDRVVGRALRDSGFGAYNFFETGDNQGFEYDPEQDPKKRHLHQEYSTYSWKGNELNSAWANYNQLNPIVSVNKLLDFMIIKYDGDHFENKDDHIFAKDQNLCIKFIDKMRDISEYFKVIDDICKHGKPIFMFELVKWDSNFR